MVNEIVQRDHIALFGQALNAFHHFLICLYIFQQLQYDTVFR